MSSNLPQEIITQMIQKTKTFQNMLRSYRRILVKAFCNFTQYKDNTRFPGEMECYCLYHQLIPLEVFVKNDNDLLKRIQKPMSAETVSRILLLKYEKDSRAHLISRKNCDSRIRAFAAKLEKFLQDEVDPELAHKEAWDFVMLKPKTVKAIESESRAVCQLGVLSKTEIIA